MQTFKRESLYNTCFYGLLGRQTQGPPRAAHTLATPLNDLTEKHIYLKNLVRLPKASQSFYVLVSAGIFNSRVWVVVSGFCLPGKDNGSLALLDVSAKSQTGEYVF